MIVGPLSEQVVAASGEHGVSLSAKPEKTLDGLILHVTFSLESTFSGSKVSFGSAYNVEFFQDDGWHILEYQPRSDGVQYATTLIEYILSPETSPITQHLNLCSFGSVFEEGMYRFVKVITIEGEDVVYAANFAIQNGY